MRVFLLLLFVVFCFAHQEGISEWAGKECSKLSPRQWKGRSDRSNWGNGVFRGVKDQCIVGAGAAGMSMAAFLKDEGQDVVVIEKEPDVGGYCDTVYFTPPAPGLPNFLDIGVGIFPNSTSANASGYGSWLLDTVAFADKYARIWTNGSGFVFPLTTVFAQNRLIDFQHGVDYGFQPQGVPPPEYLAAYARFLIEVSKYPWLNTGEIPAQIPAELKVSFNEFVRVNQLEPLMPGLFFSLVFIGGFVDLDNTPAMSVLFNLPPSILDLFTRNNTIFIIIGGCYQIYNGIANYIGQENVLTSTEITSVKRPRGNSRDPIRIRVKKNNRMQDIYCRKLVIAHPPDLKSLKYLDLSRDEKNVFEDLRVLLYYAAAFEANGGSIAAGPAQITNFNPFNQYNWPNVPCVTSALRSFPFGPFGIFGVAKDPISNDDMLDVMQAQINNVPRTLLNNTQITTWRPHEKFCPYFTISRLLENSNPYVALERLQGDQDTFWIGAARNAPNSGALWDQSYKDVKYRLRSKLLCR